LWKSRLDVFDFVAAAGEIIVYVVTTCDGEIVGDVCEAYSPLLGKG